jgi:spore photoproduct lyase
MKTVSAYTGLGQTQGTTGEVETLDRATRLLDLCATYKPYYICCMVHVLRTVQNCPYRCSYCFLQDYLTDTERKKVFVNRQFVLETLKKTLDAEPQRLFRIGTWELGDSLALDEAYPQVAFLVETFSRFENAVLELKTKSARVSPLLGLRHNQRTVVSWSVNPEEIVRKEEQGAASMKQRIEAMRIVAQEGYLLGLHFDPMLYWPDWKNLYGELVEEIFNALPAERVAWVSMGTLRFASQLKRHILLNHPDTEVLQAEMVRASDGKMRYPRPLRVQMYRYLYSQLRRFIPDECIVYLCMEKAPVWQEVFGHSPEGPEALDRLFAENLYRRFSIGPG